MKYALVAPRSFSRLEFINSKIPFKIDELVLQNSSLVDIYLQKYAKDHKIPFKVFSKKQFPNCNSEFINYLSKDENKLIIIDDGISPKIKNLIELALKEKNIILVIEKYYNLKYLLRIVKETFKKFPSIKKIEIGFYKLFWNDYLSIDDIHVNSLYSDYDLYDKFSNFVLNNKFPGTINYELLKLKEKYIFLLEEKKSDPINACEFISGFLGSGNFDIENGTYIFSSNLSYIKK